MGSSDQDPDALVALLFDRTSATRRRAAKQLRKNRVLAAGPALLKALERELKDERTWETQYQMIMALGEYLYSDALALLREESKRPHVHMVALAVGDALLRIELNQGLSLDRVPEYLQRVNAAASEGALRALAMLRTTLAEAQAAKIINWVKHRGTESHVFWAAAAAPGWAGREVHDFLEECVSSSRDETRRAAAAALQGMYLRWKPL